MFKHFLTLTFKGIRFRPLRSWLTILGIIIGTMLVVVILSLSSGVQNLITTQLQMLGEDLLIIFPGKETNPLLSFVGGQKFRVSDIMDLELLPGVRYVAPFNVVSMNVEVKGEKQLVFVHSSFLNRMRTVFEEAQGVRIQEGRWPVSEDADEVAVGYLAATKLFKNRIRVGDEIIVQSKRIRVSGILGRIGSQEDDNSLFMSWNLFHLLSGLKPSVFSAFVRTEPGADINLIALQVRQRLERQEEVSEFTVLTPGKIDRIAGDILDIVEIFLVIIALVSLIVGAVGIMNTMYTSVLERTKQIGIMKAVGATRDDVLAMFLMESGMIGFFGGLCGILLGIAGAFLIGVASEQLGVEGLFSFQALDYLGLSVVLAVTFVTGVISGILPARQAARMEPAEALRYE